MSIGAVGWTAAAASEDLNRESRGVRGGDDAGRDWGDGGGGGTASADLKRVRIDGLGDDGGAAGGATDGGDDLNRESSGVLSGDRGG
jgi:hypothetical protein